MPTTRATRRLGLLTALEGEAPALAIGDAAARHVRLTTAGLAPHLADSPAGFVPWTRVRALTVDAPTTWWPHPAIGDSIGPVLEGLLGGGGGVLDANETPTFAVGVTTDDGESVEWRATQHYLSGYRRGDARAALRLGEYLVAHPESRVLLARPAELLDRVSALVRRGPIIQ
ncbi:hypothetical protein [Microbacterium jejuense]|uniref:hypothetical protein n=1 Tax=Microbacterium jejuense TaxID=1263637 RepID=UPI0031E91530